MVRRTVAALTLAVGLVGASPAQAAEPRGDLFQVDPVTDIGLLSLALGFSGVLELILSTGEIAPQQPIASSRLSWIDRSTVTNEPGPHAQLLSDTGARLAGVYAVAAPILTGVSHGSKAGLVELTIFAESITFSWAATSLAKLAVRRPRPLAYRRQDELRQKYGDMAPNIAETDTALSFFSGHTAITSSIAATATYISFVREPDTARPWVTMSVGALLTGFVGYQRTRAAKHFPTDVIAGAMAGIGIGVLVPHLHRVSPSKVTGAETSTTSGALNSGPAPQMFSYQGRF